MAPNLRLQNSAKVGRGGGIRTPGPLVPNQMRYQAALRPDGAIISLSAQRIRDPLAIAFERQLDLPAV